MHDREMSIDDPELYYDHEDFDTGEPNCNTLYLATWKGDPLIIVMVDVLPSFEEDWNWNDDDKLLITMTGFYLIDITTAQQHQRKEGRAALFKAIERDANQLMDNFENSERSAEGPHDGKIESHAFRAA